MVDLAAAIRPPGKQPARSSGPNPRTARLRTIIDVEGLVPFDWRSFDGRAALERVMPTLPGVVTGPGMFRYFGTDESRPPYLWASHEAVGLHVCGLLDERDWHAWLDAFDRATLDWPLRDLRYS